MLAKSRTLKELLEEYQWELPTSFIDVVFLLLLYYTLTMKFHTLEQRLEAWLPKKGLEPPPPVWVLPEVVIKVQTLPGSPQTPTFRVMDWQTSDPNALAGRMAQLAQPGRDRYQVIIDGAQGCPFKHVMSALDACTRAGFTKVDFQPPPAAPPDQS
jgi:biopolymer transport protein ExbD